MNYLYRIYYGDDLVYLGRTKQKLQDRIRGHLFKKPMHRNIAINLVTKIEYAEFQSEADMNVYEVYFINLWKPPLNVDDKCKDDLTIVLPEIEWKLFETSLWNKWVKRIEEQDNQYEMRKQEKQAKFEMLPVMRNKYHNGEIDADIYYTFKQSLHTDI